MEKTAMKKRSSFTIKAYKMMWEQDSDGG